MARNVRIRIAAATVALAALLGGIHSAAADDFFKGKVISLFAGRPPGGGVDSEMRLVAQFLGDNIPGHPRVIAQNMPGAGGIVLGNYLYNVGSKDGLTLGVPGRTAFLLAPVVGNGNAKYKLPNFTWIGSAASSNFVLWIRKGTGIRNVDDLRHSTKTLIIGGSGNGNSDTVVPELMAKYEKFPFKVVRGYPGTAEQALAMQSGEIDGMFTERASFSSDPEASGLAVPIFQTFPIEPNVPLSSDVATDPREKALLALFGVPLHVGLAVVAPPGLSADRVQILRDAYVKTVTSPEYVAQATKRGFDVGQPNSGPDLRDYIDKSLSAVPDSVTKEFREYSGD
jgi:tripartite-type tricarboxylate transporter receptor subunit TctC